MAAAHTVLVVASRDVKGPMFPANDGDLGSATSVANQAVVIARTMNPGERLKNLVLCELFWHGQSI
ncbi:hypothetical protein D3C75_1379150 [compost metagenome]